MHSFSNGTSIQTKLGNWQQLERVSRREISLTSQTQPIPVQVTLQFIDGSGLCSKELFITYLKLKHQCNNFRKDVLYAKRFADGLTECFSCHQGKANNTLVAGSLFCERQLRSHSKKLVAVYLFTIDFKHRNQLSRLTDHTCIFSSPLHTYSSSPKRSWIFPRSILKAQSTANQGLQMHFWREPTPC